MSDDPFDSYSPEGKLSWLHHRIKLIKDVERFHFGLTGLLTAVVWVLVMVQIGSCDDIELLQRGQEQARQQAERDRLQGQLDEALRRLGTLEGRQEAARP
jgi:hypothetical protein